MTLDARISALLELAPAGLTDGQLLWRLKIGGARHDGSELMAALDRLAQSGQTRAERGRWYRSRLPHSARGSEVVRRPKSENEPPGNVLRAAPASSYASAAPESTETSGGKDGAAADPATLLRYYAASQRRDPRGSVETFPDQHGTKWHLFDAHGPWWDGRTAAIPARLLEPGFRQTLAEIGNKGTAAAGWPIGVFRDENGTVCLPLLLLPVEWRLEDDRLLFCADRVRPALNPAISRRIRRLTGVGDDALQRALEPDEDDADLASAGRRLAHLLARIGGGGLSPGALTVEMALSGEGLRNAAALFLPDEASFTRRLAEDLDKLAVWPLERLAGTALSGFLPMEQVARSSRLADPVELSPLTDRQFTAGDAALSGTSSAIQGHLAPERAR